MFKTMNKIGMLSFIIYIVFAAVGMLSFGNAQDLPMSIYVNNERVEFDEQKPYIDSNDRTQVPVRFLTEKLGSKVGWNGEIQRVTITKGKLDVILDIDSNVSIVNGKKVTMDTKAVLKNSRTVVPLRFVSEAFGFDVDYDFAPDNRFDGKERHIIDINGNISSSDLIAEDKTNPFNEKIAYIDGDIFNLDEFNKDAEGKSIPEYKFTVSGDIINGLVSFNQIESIYTWSPYYPLAGKGPEYNFFEGLDKVQESFYTIEEGEYGHFSGFKFGDYPSYVVDSHNGTIKSSELLIVNDKTGDVWVSSRTPWPEDNKEDWSVSIDRDFSGSYYANRDVWHFGLSWYENTGLYFPRITMDKWYDFTKYKEGIMSVPRAGDLSTVKPLIQFWSNSYEDSQMIWRTIEFIIRGVAFPEEQTEEYEAILEGLKQGTIVEYPDGTRIKFTDVYGFTTTNKAVEILFMSMPFEEDSFERSIDRLIE